MSLTTTLSSIDRAEFSTDDIWCPQGRSGSTHRAVSLQGRCSIRLDANATGRHRFLRDDDGLPKPIGCYVARATLCSYVRYLDDFPVTPLSTTFGMTLATAASTDAKSMWCRRATRVIERCLLMTTDPGDLVLDPTCGSGTTAFVAEKWGRRWITCDTSRVAVTLAKQRLMTASFDYYELKYPLEGLKGGFIYKTVPHVTLKSIANNPEIDEIYERLHPAVDAGARDTEPGAPRRATIAVHRCGRRPQGQDGRLHARRRARRSISRQAKRRRPAHCSNGRCRSTSRRNGPPRHARAFDAFHEARQRMQRQMDASIAAHADPEVLYDQPLVSKDKLRITGPFSVEAVPFPSVFALDEARTPEEADVAIARSGETSRQHQWRDELLRTGIRGKGGQMMKFAALETLPDTRYLHVSGNLADSGERVVVSFGPEHGALEQRQVEMAMREAGDLFPRPKMIVFAAFAFDPEAAKDIDQTKGIVALKAQMNTDLLTEDLKKARSSNQSFWLMGQPDIDVRTAQGRALRGRGERLRLLRHGEGRAGIRRQGRRSRCGCSTPTTTSDRSSRARCSFRWPARRTAGTSCARTSVPSSTRRDSPSSTARCRCHSRRATTARSPSRSWTTAASSRSRSFGWTRRAPWPALNR